MLNLMREQGGLVRQRGFTLVEMIIVMAILGVVIMATMSLFIPAVRSTSVQTQVSDVQSNLRLALDRMTHDLLLAGFLVSPEDVTGGGAAGALYWEGGDPATDLTIRTRTVINAFGRVLAYDSGKIGLSDADMALPFPPGTKIRLFEPMTAEEFEPGVVYTVTDNATPATIDAVTYPALTVTSSGTLPSAMPAETVVVKIKDGAAPSLQTIRYRVVDGALQRIVNGATQLLARNVASVLFAYQNSATGAVKRVDITLTGQPVSLAGGGIESSPKQRSLFTSVSLRNVY